MDDCVGDDERAEAGKREIIRLEAENATLKRNAATIRADCWKVLRKRAEKAESEVTRLTAALDPMQERAEGAERRLMGDTPNSRCFIEKDDPLEELARELADQWFPECGNTQDFVDVVLSGLRLAQQIQPTPGACRDCHSTNTKTIIVTKCHDCRSVGYAEDLTEKPTPSADMEELVRDAARNVYGCNVVEEVARRLLPDLQRAEAGGVKKGLEKAAVYSEQHAGLEGCLAAQKIRALIEKEVSDEHGT